MTPRPTPSCTAAIGISTSSTASTSRVSPRGATTAPQRSRDPSLRPARSVAILRLGGVARGQREGEEGGTHQALLLGLLLAGQEPADELPPAVLERVALRRLRRGGGGDSRQLGSVCHAQRVAAQRPRACRRQRAMSATAHCTFTCAGERPCGVPGRMQMTCTEYWGWHILSYVSPHA